MMRYKKYFLVVCLLCMSQGSLHSWGFWAHKQINRMAVYTLPPQMMAFYKPNIEFITDHATDPDKRRYALLDEAPRHYIDIDHYGSHPFDSVPKRWDDAIKKYTEDTLNAYGIVPWHINKMYFRLVEAFKKGDANYILKISADIGHYIGDAHVPLHTTENYNGQMTNQVGIHGLLESRIPEMLGSDYDYFVGKAKYIKSPLAFAWKAVEQSHAALDSVFNFEKLSSQQVPPDRKYAYEDRQNVNIRTYSAEFTATYSTMLNGLVERRMRQAIIGVGSIWYSAWVQAGEPDLYKLTLKPPTQDELDELNNVKNQYEGGNIKGRTEAQ